MSTRADLGTVTLSLISHTNVGKTTLARTLLRRDVGEVADQPHVTDVSEAHTLIETEDGLCLRLWDTPGFGDSAHLLKRLKSLDSPIGWFLAQVWDRYRDRPKWCSQQAVRNIQDDADIVLYLVNATEDPATAGYVGLEMQILEWIGKPVIVLVNQMGPPREAAREQADIGRWRTALEKYQVVRETLALDAFARCWVQEGQLLDVVEELLPEAKRPAQVALSRAWQQRNLAIFHESSRVLARQIVQAAQDTEPVEAESWDDKVKAGIGPILGKEFKSAGQRAMTALNARANAGIIASTNKLIALHELEGESAAELLQALRDSFIVAAPVDTTKAAVIGGFVSGALGGLAADLAAGGLTLGGGALIGGILGAAGVAGIAKGYNLVRGADHAEIRWSTEVLVTLLAGALVRYLAVAHFGRGRGAWQDSDAPRFWQDEVEAVLRDNQHRLSQAIKQAQAGSDASIDVLDGLIRQLLEAILMRLHPQARAVF